MAFTKGQGVVEPAALLSRLGKPGEGLDQAVLFAAIVGVGGKEVFAGAEGLAEDGGGFLKLLLLDQDCAQRIVRIDLFQLPFLIARFDRNHCPGQPPVFSECA